MKKIGFITTSRADFGIFLPLIRLIEQHPDFDYLIFAGGMHTSPHFGMSYKILENHYKLQVAEKLVSLTNDDTPTGIAQSMALTSLQYASIWKKYKTELAAIAVLGDRFEMFGAAASVLPFNIPLIHFHGGETTIGAVDNKFRHALTAISDYHFTSHEKHFEVATQISQSTKNVYNVGAMGIDAAKNVNLMSREEFQEQFDFDISQPYFLTTYHPETVDLRNDIFIKEFLKAIEILQIPVLCTLPNADTQGSVIRKAFLDFEKKHPKLMKCHENLGQRGYLTAMSQCLMMLGNTSSGIIEAGAFHKLVLNVGTRQEGRHAGKNVINVENNAKSIVEGYQKATQITLNNFENPYGNGNSAERVMAIFEQLFLK